MGIEPLENEYPAFQVPLTDDQLAEMGYIAVLWGQVDFIIDELLLFAFKIGADKRQVLIGDKQLGSRVDLLANNLSAIRPKATKALVQRFCAVVRKSKNDRNTAFHGAWGWYIRGPNTPGDPAARTSKAPKTPFFPARFPALRAELTYASRIGWEAVCLLKDWSLNKGAARLTFGSAQKDGSPPSWLGTPDAPPDPGRPPQGRTSKTRQRPPKPQRQKSEG